MRLKHIKGSEEVVENSNIVIKKPEEHKGKWNKVFSNNRKIYIEIGMGKGNFLIEHARRNPKINYIGVEKYPSVLLKAIKTIEEEKLNNIKIICIDAINIDNIFDKEVSKIYLNFSDPWPKKRHAKRRLTSPEFLKKYDLIFKNNNHIVMKTDNKDLFSYSIKTLNNHGYYINHITFDLEKEQDSLNIMTEYEEKFTKLNNPIYKIDVIKGKK